MPRWLRWVLARLYPTEPCLVIRTDTDSHYGNGGRCGCLVVVSRDGTILMAVDEGFHADLVEAKYPDVPHVKKTIRTTKEGWEWLVRHGAKLRGVVLDKPTKKQVADAIKKAEAIKGKKSKRA